MKTNLVYTCVCVCVCEREREREREREKYNKVIKIKSTKMY